MESKQGGGRIERLTWEKNRLGGGRGKVREGEAGKNREIEDSQLVS